MADFEKRKYRRAHLVWTSRELKYYKDEEGDEELMAEDTVLHPTLRDRIDNSQTARSQIEQFRVLNVEFFPRESHLITFRDPYSFPVLFHPACNNLVRQHLEDIAQKVRRPKLRSVAIAEKSEGGWCLRCARRIPHDPILQTENTHTRSQHPMFTPRTIRTRRAGSVREISRRLPSGYESPSRRPIHLRPISGPLRAFHPRVHIPGDGA